MQRFLFGSLDLHRSLIFSHVKAECSLYSFFCSAVQLIQVLLDEIIINRIQVTFISLFNVISINEQTIIMQLGSPYFLFNSNAQIQCTLYKVYHICIDSKFKQMHNDTNIGVKQIRFIQFEPHTAFHGVICRNS